MGAPTGRESFDTLSDGTALTTANTSFTGVGGTGTKAARTAAAIKGNRGAEFSGTDISSFGDWTDAGSGSRGLQIYFTRDATNPTGANHGLGQIRNSGGVAASCSVTTAGVLQVGSASTTLRNFISNTSLPAGRYVLTVVATKGTSTSNGRVQAWLRNADTDSLVESYDSGATVNTGTTDLVTSRVGKTNGTGVSGFYIDEPAYSVGATDEIDRIPITPSSSGWQLGSIAMG